MTSCAQSNIKKCSLELGGKSPLVIFADADLDKAVKHVRHDEKFPIYQTFQIIQIYLLKIGNVVGIFQQRRKLHCGWSSVR